MFDSMAELRANAVPYALDSVVMVTSWHAGTQTGGGLFRRMDGRSADDGGLVIADARDQRWGRILDGALQAVHFGVRPYSPAVTPDADAPDSGESLQRALDAARRERLPLELPAARIKATTNVVHETGRGWEPGGGTALYGHGRVSEVLFEDTIAGGLFGFAIREDDTVLRDFTILLKRKPNGAGMNGAAVYLPSAGKTKILRPRFERVHFEGYTQADRAKYFGVQPLNVDVDGEEFRDCSGRFIAFGWVKDMSDCSTQRNPVHRGWRFRDCVEGLEFNSPGLLRSNATAGSPRVSAVSSALGAVMADIPVRVGAPVRSINFPSGTVVVSVDSVARTILFSENAINTMGGLSCRLSFGGLFDVRVDDLAGEGIDNWLAGFAHVTGFYCETSGRQVKRELVHVEDVSTAGDIVVTGVSCNTRQGVLDAAQPDGENANANGMVHISTGSRGIHVHFRHADLRGDQTRNRTALAVQTGGISGTTGREEVCGNISVSGTIYGRGRKTRGGGVNPDISEAIVSSGADLIFKDLTLINDDPADKGDTFLRAPGAGWSGTVTIINPKVIATCGVNDVMHGAFDRLTLRSTEGGFADLRWGAGYFPAALNGFALARAVRFHVQDTIGPDSSWKTLCPMPRRFLGTVLRQYHGSGNNKGFETGPFEIARGALLSTVLLQEDGGDMTLPPGRPMALFTNGTVAAGSPLLTALGSVANVEIGTLVGGAGIPAGARVLLVESETSVRIDSLATDSAADTALSFTPPAKSTHGWRADGGRLQYRAYAATEGTADLCVLLDGILVPDVPLGD